jgi:competence protein ComEA
MGDRIRRRDGPAEVREKLVRLVRDIDDPDPPDHAVPSLTELDPDQPACEEPLDANPTGRAGDLVERWVPGGGRTVAGLRARLNRHRLAAAVLLVLVAIGTTVVVLSQRPEAEPAPALSAAISATEQAATEQAATETQDARIVVSVVGRVLHPGLVTLAGGARVLDAVTAAGGVPPGTDLTTLNLARKLADGEQIYVGIPVPPGAEPLPAAPATSGGKGKKGDSQGPINLNSASADQLETLPGVGPATAQRIITWRDQHGPFTSVGQLRQVGGVGAAKFNKIESLVTV